MTEVFVVRNKVTGSYWSSATAASSAPTVYLSAGKAGGRRKQLDYWNDQRGRPHEWEVKRWNIAEVAV